MTDMELNDKIVSISSVSGGSVANGIVAQHGPFDSLTAPALGAAIRPGLRNLASDGLFAFGPATDGWFGRLLMVAALFVDLLVALVAATLAAGRDWAPWWWLMAGAVLGGAGWSVAKGLPNQLRATLTAGLVLSGPLTAAAVSVTTSGSSPVIAGGLATLVVAVVGVFAVLFGEFRRRSVVVEHALASVHFADSAGQPTPLSSVDGPVHHVFCATELQSGDHVYLTPRLVYGYRVGKGGPGALTLATAVQTSACLPGAFSPRSIPTEGFGLTRSWDVEDDQPPTVPARLVANDGGVYDNMADQWEQGFQPRVARVGRVQEPAQELVVVNASRSMQWAAYPTSSFAHEISGVTRTGSILYDVSTSHRRQALVARFRASKALGTGLRGALVNVAQSPYDVPRAFQHDKGEAGGRARVAMGALSTLARSEDDWKSLARSNSGVRTTLGALTVPVTADLLEHAWVLAVVNIYVLLGYGTDVIEDLARLAGRRRFEMLCS